MTLAFVFPGQGSQSISMGKDLAERFPAAKGVFAEVDDALGQKLTTIMWDGPPEQLTLTSNAQPALMACSVAVMRVLESEFGIGVRAAKYVAGHSLGEYSALCASGAISLSDTARLLRLRGNVMQDAVPVGAGAMAALLGASVEDATAAVKAGSASGICQIANDNATGQIVISGEKAAVEAACAAATEIGIKKAMMLQVSAPFHCDMMAPAGEAMAAALLETDIETPIVPLVNNVTARPVTDPDDIRRDLVEQVTGRVRWRESVEWMAGEAGIETFAEIGTGKVLTVMLKRIIKGVSGTAVNSVEAIEDFADSLRGEV